MDLSMVVENFVAVCILHGIAAPAQTCARTQTNLASHEPKNAWSGGRKLDREKGCDYTPNHIRLRIYVFGRVH